MNMPPDEATLESRVLAKLRKIPVIGAHFAAEERAVIDANQSVLDEIDRLERAHAKAVPPLERTIAGARAAVAEAKMRLRAAEDVERQAVLSLSAENASFEARRARLRQQVKVVSPVRHEKIRAFIVEMDNLDQSTRKKGPSVICQPVQTKTSMGNLTEVNRWVPDEAAFNARRQAIADAKAEAELLDLADPDTIDARLAELRRRIPQR